MQKTLAIDPTKKSAGLKIASCEPLVSSFVEAGWNSIDIESYLLSANDGIGLSLKSKLESGAVNQMYVDSAATFLASHLLENYCAHKHNIEENTNVLSCKDLQQVVDYIDAHLDWNLGLTELANLVGMSHYHFSRLFKKSMGVSPHRYLIERRIERVTHLLVSTNLGIAEIAKLTGFSSHSHLCHTFRKHMSVSPDRYRTDVCANWRFKN